MLLRISTVTAFCCIIFEVVLVTENYPLSSTMRCYFTVGYLHCRTDGKEWKRLIDAGINDWGGISPVTKDWVNPEVLLLTVLIFL